MNEQLIKQLAGQAKFMTEEELNCKLSFNTELKTFSEFLARIIIRECANAVSNTDVGDVEGGDYAVLMAASQHIKKHFRVKE